MKTPRYLLYVAQNIQELPLKRIAYYQMYMGKTIGETIQHLMDVFSLTIEEAREVVK